ncbi:alpha and gamma adaptin binding protein p34 domain-containing protein [Ditylenchus destructor]|uniref:Alpha and gamma adaptin binding protein p34 domain-containing protein n=1 Tax=Ditylenchus destructor TaxID=166010 RepID=A0AAD4N4R5_9BILA|nr:alpha and gamma adaptin binding protein p34 domain-containing protein [Ditylenchus destructor]
METKENGVCLLIDLDNRCKEFLCEIIAHSNSLEHGALQNQDASGLSQSYLIPIETKYYTAEFELKTVDNFSTAHEWCLTAQAILVGGDVSIVTSNQTLMQRFCVDEGIEQIELHPNEEAKASLVEFHEKWGVPRMWEVLESVNWPNKRMKKNPVTSAEHRKRLQEYIDKCHDEEGYEMELLPMHSKQPEDPDFPDSEDEAAILKLFDKLKLGRPTNPWISNFHTEQALNVIFDNLQQAHESRSGQPGETSPIDEQKTNDDLRKSKKKKNRKSKSKTEPDFTAAETVNPSTAPIAPGSSNRDHNVTDIFGNVLNRTSGGQFRASSFDPTKLGEIDDFSTLIGQLNEARDREANLEMEQRITLAERLTSSISEKLGTEDNDAKLNRLKEAEQNIEKRNKKLD